MCDEGVMIPRGKRRHPHGFRVALMLVEDRKVGLDDLAQNHLHTSNDATLRPHVSDLEHDTVASSRGSLQLAG